MREIKFRAWDEDYKYMNYKVIVGMWGDKRVMDDENYTACAMWIDPSVVDYDCEPHWAHFEPYSNVVLEQYTGLKDRNGTEIYEGDIVFLTSGECFWGVYEYDEIVVIRDARDANWYLEHFKEWDNINVIGNIHENPGLLGDSE